MSLELGLRQAAAPSPFRRLLSRSPSAVFGALVVGGILLVAIVAVFWTPYGPLTVSTGKELLPPSGAHLMGTDEYGRDVLSRLMSGTDLTLLSSVGAVLIAGLVGVPAGLLAASRRGVVGEAIMRLADLLSSVANRDLITVQDIVMLVATVVVVANLLVDLLYRVVDPRLEVGG